MAELSSLAQVWIWGRFVGAVVERDEGPPVFEYDAAFRKSGLELSPRHLPLRVEGPRVFPQLARIEAFDGLPGLLSDALPDRFGNAVITKYFEDKGRPDDALSAVQKLLYIGERAMGALTFRPAFEDIVRPDEAEALELARLVEQARLVVEGETRIVLPEIMSLGASAGGARPKAIILWNPGRNEMRSAFAVRQEGDQDWLIKFDGVGELGSPDAEPRPYNRIEYAYSRMAREAGIEMAETELLTARCYAHFMTRRFDRRSGRRLHMHTLGGMEHVDYNAPGLYSYEEWFRLIFELELGYPALSQAFLRAVFNILAVNQDDHVKNISFLMDEEGRWMLAPAYDLTFAAGRGYTSRHQMSFAGKRDGFVAEDLIAVGKKFGLRDDGREEIMAVADALASWPDRALEAGVPRARVKAIQARFRRGCVPG